MKTTVKNLRRLIREAQEEIEAKSFDIDVVEDAWAGGDDLVEPIDQLKAMGIKERLRLKMRVRRIMAESMKDLHINIGDSILRVVEEYPGIDGMGLINVVTEELKSDPDIIYSEDLMDAQAIFAVLDDLQEEGTVWLDEMEDAVYVVGTPDYAAALAAREL